MGNVIKPMFSTTVDNKEINNDDTTTSDENSNEDINTSREEVEAAETEADDVKINIDKNELL